MIKPGIILIEVMLALVISSMLAASLLFSLYQMNITQDAVTDLVTTYGKIAIVRHQLARDIMGAFVPVQFDAQQTAPEKEKQKPLDKIFYSVNKEGKLDTLTFITSNPMEVYWGKKSGKPKPRIARVVYRVQPEKRRKNSYVLMRQEGSQLDFAVYKQDAKDAPRTYQVVDGIKDLVITYFTKTKAEEKKPPEYKTAKEWKEQQKDKKITLPSLVEVRLALWDSSYKREDTFVFTVPLLAQPPEGEQQKKEEKEKQEKQKKEQETKKQVAQNKQQTSEVEVHMITVERHEKAT